MKISDFLDKYGIEEDFIDRTWDDDPGFLDTLVPIIYTKPRIDKAIKEIKVFAKGHKGIKSTEIDFYEDGGFYHLYKGKYYEQDIKVCKIPLKKEVNLKLDKLYPQKLPYESHHDFGEKYHDYIQLRWFTSPKNRRYWYPVLDGRPICGRNFRNFLFNTNAHENCPSPDEFKEICNDLTYILKKHGLRLLD